jgi:hypothetical protein
LDTGSAFPGIGTGYQLPRWNAGATLPPLLPGDPEPPISDLDQIFIYLAVLREAHHQLRDSVGEVVPV